jgi:ubiquinone/menaquinone biosynthesis C-methylase UbiE/uncharacterized protein YbaR (Trm112 family)
MDGGKTDIDLVSPDSHARLRARPFSTVVLASSVRLIPPIPVGYKPIGPTDSVLATDDNLTAYPIVNGIPVLMAPEKLRPLDERNVFDVSSPRYVEAYAEMAHYSEDAVADTSAIAGSRTLRELTRLRNLPVSERTAFPNPAFQWLDATYELHAQWKAFDHLGPLRDSRVLQLGGRGIQAIKFLLAGADAAWLVTPMLGELLFARELATRLELEDRLVCIGAIAEELPFPSGVFDCVYIQGSLHHTVVADSLAESRRVLRSGGRFAAVEPWRAPGYALGIRILGKRDPAVRCEVLTSRRIEPHLAHFTDAKVTHYGAMTRYPAIALGKLGVRASHHGLWAAGRIDDFVSSIVPPLRRMGSSVAITAIA